MKNVIKSRKCTVPEAQKTASASFSVKSAAVIALGLSLTSILLTGCFDPDIQPSVVRGTVNTEASVYIEDNTLDTAEDTAMPYGVTLQADPAVLVPCDLERVVDGDTIIEDKFVRSRHDYEASVMKSVEFLFSVPNVYPYGGLDIHTIDLFFLCRVKCTKGATAMDDAAEVLWLPWQEVRPEDFGLKSISLGVRRLLGMLAPGSANAR